MRDRRRKAGSFLCALFLVLSLCGCGAGGQEASTESEEESAEQYDLYRVGIVQESEDELWNTVTKSIQRELYVKGKQAGIRFDYKKYTEVADGNRALIDEIGQDFLDAEVDGIIAVGPLAAMRMKQCTKGTGIPVVFAVTSDPLEEGLLKSMERPEGNITGAADIIEIRTLLQMMISADSDIERVGLLYNGENESSRQSMAEAKRYLDSKGIGFEEATGSNEDEIFSAAYALVEDGVDAVITPADPAVQNCEQSIYQLFVDAGIPHYGGTEEFAAQGAFLGYGANGKQLGIAAADLAAEILIEGTAVNELPVQMMTQGVAVVNSETAESIGVNVDSIRKVFRSICGEVSSTKTAVAPARQTEGPESY